ncbi:MAG: YaeI-like metallophosphoesterase [Candidatus Desulfovibrio kirbyi]|jgi:predicted MPP superfamily phosphohydrolase|uniref:YaeI-like metallophosphoesterase n=1 Tax=Candidatus Desulfovibrio kirbyi TaxID=2696086 RepID=A0A6L2R777_9BACT|nr:metallophosphoesterase [Desulfovibrio sp.]GFH63400.1 MAG: YaeI-like metallophosphoesterase [Candidatus Desulfovibrio kirbyi]
MLHIFTAILSVYLALRLVVPLRLNFFLKVLLSGIILLCGMKLLLLHLTFGSLTPELSRNVIISTGILHGALVLLTVFCLARDILSIALRLLRKIFPGLCTWGPRLSNAQWAAGLLVIALLLSALSVRQAVRVPDMQRLSLTLDRLPKNLDGLRIVHLSDTHVSATFPKEWVQAIVTKINALNPDLVVITGDIADGQVALRAKDMAPLAQLRAPLGVFSCAGNHEYYWGFQEWMQQSRQLNITPLQNTHIVLRTKGERLVLAGLTDEAGKRYGLPGPDLRAALNNAPEDAVRILLAHRPQLVAQSAQANVDLQLSGHTHGGQIVGMNYFVRLFNNGFLSGLYRMQNTLLYISNGAGLWAGFPSRLCVPSEITELTLRAG